MCSTRLFNIFQRPLQLIYDRFTDIFYKNLRKGAKLDEVMFKIEKKSVFFSQNKTFLLVTVNFRTM